MGDSPAVKSMRGRRRILNPPGFVFHAVVVALAILMVAGGWLERSLSGEALFVMGVIVFVTWVLLGAIWLISGILAFRSRLRGVRWLQWTISPVILFGLFAGFMPVFHLQFWLSRPALERWAQRIEESPSVSSVAEPSLNFIDIHHPQKIPGGVCFYTLVGEHWLDTQGLAYSSQALPLGVNVNGRYYKAYCGNWYTFWES
jgi:energy-coupling factor transporter transmembrane protein EcfT